MDRSHLNEKMKIGMNDDSNRKCDMNLRTKTINNSVSISVGNVERGVRKYYVLLTWRLWNEL